MVLTATVVIDLECSAQFIWVKLMLRGVSNVNKMKILKERGYSCFLWFKTLKDALNEAMRDCVQMLKILFT